MNRREHLIKAGDALSQVIAHLQAAGEETLASMYQAREESILDLIDAEKRGADTDDAYEQMVDDEMGCL